MMTGVHVEVRWTVLIGGGGGKRGCLLGHAIDDAANEWIVKWWQTSVNEGMHDEEAKS